MKFGTNIPLYVLYEKINFYSKFSFKLLTSTLFSVKIDSFGTTFSLLQFLLNKFRNSDDFLKKKIIHITLYIVPIAN